MLQLAAAAASEHGAEGDGAVRRFRDQPQQPRNRVAWLHLADADARAFAGEGAEAENYEPVETADTLAVR